MKPILADKRPTDTIYALMSQHVYEGEQLKRGSRLPNHPDWVIDETHAGKLDYFGVIYSNYKENQIVVAHRGTNGLATLAWLENFQGIYRGEISPQKEDAFIVVDKAKEMAKMRGAHLSFTGHSLGAFLAELSVFYSCTDEEVGHVNAVVFESPGSRESMKRLQSSLKAERIDLTTLDIIEYLSYPNRINACNHHVGTVYQLQPDLLGQPENWGWRWNFDGYLQQSHLMKGLLEQFKAEGYPIAAKYMQSWPVGKEQKVFFKQAGELNEDGQYIATPEAAEALFRLKYEGHYHEEKSLSGSHVLPLRHFDPALQRVLVAFYSWWQERRENEAVQEGLIALKLPEKIVEHLLSYQLIKRASGMAIKLIESSKDIHSFRVELSAWLAENQNYKSLTQLMIELKTTNFELIVAIVAPGAEVAENAVISNVEVLGVKIALLEGSDEKEVEHARAILHQFQSATKRAEVYAVAPGGKMLGKMENSSAAALGYSNVPRSSNAPGKK